MKSLLIMASLFLVSLDPSFIHVLINFPNWSKNSNSIQFIHTVPTFHTQKLWEVSIGIHIRISNQLSNQSNPSSVLRTAVNPSPITVHCHSQTHSLQTYPTQSRKDAIDTDCISVLCGGGDGGLRRKRLFGVRLVI